MRRRHTWQISGPKEARDLAMLAISITLQQRNGGSVRVDFGGLEQRDDVSHTERDERALPRPAARGPTGDGPTTKKPASVLLVALADAREEVLDGARRVVHHAPVLVHQQRLELLLSAVRVQQRRPVVIVAEVL